jgi:transcriptional regulator NrdR family protein
MKCPLCGHEHGRVLRSDGERRRRECGMCRHRWTTHEVDDATFQQYQAALDAARRLASFAPQD